MAREQWKSRIGFIWAAVGSAVGLGSIWRFPYVVGENGGATFVVLFLVCLLVVGIPVLVSEITVGRKTHKSPSGAFQALGRWGATGKATIITGFLVSTFYGVIAGWTLGYLIEGIKGGLTSFSDAKQAQLLFSHLTSSALWSVGYLSLFMCIAGSILYFGVQRGIERSNKILMPLLVIVLLVLAVKGLTLPGGGRGVTFLFAPDWSLITPTAVIMALGQAFFSLSLGQGTMVTYGSYLSKKENLPGACFPIAFFGVLISLLAGIAIFTTVFAVGKEPTDGMGLLFQTLPLIFSKMTGGYFLCLAFFLLIFLAGLTSQISALEPSISYFIDEKGWSRHKAVTIVTISSLVVGIPSALSFLFLSGVNSLCVNVLIPLGGLAVVLLVGWKWGIQKALAHMHEGAGGLFARYPFLAPYFRIGIKYIAPVIIVIILIDSLGVF